MEMLFISLIVIFSFVFVIKFLGFIFSVLLAGAGLLIKIIVGLFVAVPVVPVILVLGTLLSFGGVFFLGLFSLVIYFVVKGESNYEKRYR